MINQLTILVTMLLALLTFLVPRKYLLLPYILAACFVPTDQRIFIMDLDFTPLRMLVLAGFLRLLLQPDGLSVKWNSFDEIVLAWAICGAAIYFVQWLDARALIYKSGVLFDVIGLYWLFRICIRSWSDIKLLTKMFALCSLVLAVFVAFEWATGRNPFAILGRVITTVREERYRCQASFPHSIMLGLFWATLVPLFLAFAGQDKNKLLFRSGVAASAFIVIATASSTPIVASLAALIGLSAYRWRKHTAYVACCLVTSLVALHIVMKAPVWHLIARINLIGGSTGWHRYYLIDKAITHFGEWVVIGCRSTAHWGMGLGDVTNQFILEGVRGGLVTLVLFLVMLYHALKIILSISLRTNSHGHQWVAWCFFVAMATHCVGFFGVSYFGQITMVWYMMLAFTGFLAEDKFLSKIRPSERFPRTAIVYNA